MMGRMSGGVKGVLQVGCRYGWSNGFWGGMFLCKKLKI